MITETVRRDVQTATQNQGKDEGRESIVILLVDDDPDCRLLIADAITECKVSNRVFEVSSGEEALEFLNGGGKYGNPPKPGLIYLDIEMPGMGGQETLKRIKEDPTL